MNSAVIRLLCLLVPVMLTVSACWGDDDGGGDDDDDGTLDPVGCQIVWVTSDPPGQESTYDYYLVDGPLSLWTTGDHNYYQGDPEGTTNVTGAWVDDYDIVSREWAQAAVATSGTFSLVVGSGLEIGGSVEFEDATDQDYFLLDPDNNLSTPLGASGTGTFIGEWSNPLSSDVEPGSGTVSFAFSSTAHTLGIDVAWAQCYEAGGGAFAAESRIERIKKAGDRAGALLAR